MPDLSSEVVYFGQKCIAVKEPKKSKFGFITYNLTCEYTATPKICFGIPPFTPVQLHKSVCQTVGFERYAINTKILCTKSIAGYSK